uniref:Uncharacterized protein n=1 Tax=Echeneis naucrates TaxID=173247 RepID=A0A665WCA5_ECHNA
TELRLLVSLPAMDLSRVTPPSPSGALTSCYCIITSQIDICCGHSKCSY